VPSLLCPCPLRRPVSAQVERPLMDLRGFCGCARRETSGKGVTQSATFSSSYAPSYASSSLDGRDAQKAQVMNVVSLTSQNRHAENAAVVSSQTRLPTCARSRPYLPLSPLSRPRRSTSCRRLTAWAPWRWCRASRSSSWAPVARAGGTYACRKLLSQRRRRCCRTAGRATAGTQTPFASSGQGDWFVV